MAKKTGYKKTIGKAKSDSSRQQKTYEYRVYPTKEQEEYIQKLLGLKRLYWNLNTEQKNLDENYKAQTYANTFRQFKPEAMEWLKEVNVVPLNQAFLDIRQSWQVTRTNNRKNKYKYEKQLEDFLAGKRKNAPKEYREKKYSYKSKKNKREGLHFNSCDFRDGKLFLTRKFGLLAGAFGCRFCEGRKRSVTLSCTATGKWFVKIVVEKIPDEKCKNGKTIGIDWNCRDEAFLAMSDGTIVKCPRFLKKKAKMLKHKQKELSRRKYSVFVQKFGRMPDFRNPVDCEEFKALPVSNNYLKTQQEVAKLHEKVAWQRKDWLHKLSRELANNFQYIAFEDIDLQVMAKKRKNSGLGHGKVLADQGFGMFRQFCAYKAEVIKVSPKNTSKTCHNCKHIEPSVVLGVEHWVCPNCGVHHDRDLNAALNIMAESIVGRGRAEIKNACGAPSSAVKQEVGRSILSNEITLPNIPHL